MINKQGLIFLTLTCLILVLSIYYITMPNELLLTTNGSYLNNKEKISDNTISVNIIEENIIDTMHSILTEERVKLLKKLIK